VCAGVMLTGMQAQAREDTYPNKVKTHIGELTFDHGIPTEETSEKLYYEMDYHRAVQTPTFGRCPSWDRPSGGSPIPTSTT
jgi:hypothetical protein